MKSRGPIPITTFEVWKGGTLAEAGFEENTSRRDFYQCRDQWKGPGELVEAMDECPPLAWQILDAYSDFLREREAEIESANPASARKLNAKLDAMPEESENGAREWIARVPPAVFRSVARRMSDWFDQPPDWASEEDYIDEHLTAHGAALAYFRDMDASLRNDLKILIVEGEHPGSTYYAAELAQSDDEANRVAEAVGLAIRFVERFDR